MKKHLLCMMIGIILFGFGCCYFFLEITDFQYKDENPILPEDQRTQEFHFSLDHSIYDFHTADIYPVEIIEDNSLDGEVVVKATYYKGLDELTYRMVDQTVGEKDVYFEIDPKNHYEMFRTLYHQLITGLKEKTIFNFSYYIYPQIEIRVSSKDRYQVKVSTYYTESEFAYE